jgi:hypothetical protein
MTHSERDRDDAEDVQERAEPDAPPVDGPSSGSGGQPGEKDLSGSSQGEPGGSGS